MAPWRLEGFDDCIQRWRGIDLPVDSVVRDVVQWFLTELARDPFPPSAAPVGGEFPPTWWFVKLPYITTAARRVVCLYEINATDRVLICRILSVLAEPI